MILLWFIVIPVLGGLLAWPLERWHTRWPRWVSLAALLVDLALAVTVWVQHFDQVTPAGQGVWLAELRWPWIPRFGISFHLALDGLSLLMVLLTLFLGAIAVLTSWGEIRERVGFFHFNVMWVLAGVLGVFLAVDLFLFYFFWELMLVPMYFLIAIWGHENRVYAAVKFFLFTQAGGLLMLIAILALALVHQQATGTLTFGYVDLLGTAMSPATASWLMLGFFVAFAVKLPVVPLHTWLPDAHTEAPTAGSVILAGLLLKTGAYGLLRFAIPLFPEAARALAPAAMALGVVGILYGAVLAFAQTDLKRLVAYTSVSHLGFVLLGAFAWNELALQGAVLEMICHGLSTGGLFMLVGALQERIHTRDMRRLGGLWSVAPRMGGVGLFFAMASLGLPGLGNFVSEFLVLVGTYQANRFLAVVAALGLVAATLYSLRLLQRTFYGPNAEGWVFPDLSPRDMSGLALVMIVLVWLGLYPQPALDTAAPALHRLRRPAAPAEQVALTASSEERPGDV
ncbi:MAG: NADH-quinone oxidoreductase subunit M [Thermodesulfobacteriota bacterium]|jgi:NADH-quinone oxidoreductase subunit M